MLLKKEGKHTLSYATFDMETKCCELTFYFDHEDEIDDIVKFIDDCGFYLKNENEFDYDIEYKNFIINTLEDFYIKDQIFTDYKSIDPGNYYYDNSHTDDIIKNLKKNKYAVLNRYNKWYTYAYSIDYTRFKIFAKDTEERIIEWNTEKSKQGDIINIVDKNDDELFGIIVFQLHGHITYKQTFLH